MLFKAIWLSSISGSPPCSVCLSNVYLCTLFETIQWKILFRTKIGKYFYFSQKSKKAQTCQDSLGMKLKTKHKTTLCHYISPWYIHIFEYCVQFWSSHLKKEIEKIGQNISSRKDSRWRIYYQAFPLVVCFSAYRHHYSEKNTLIKFAWL